MSQPFNDRNQAASSGTVDSKQIKLERVQAVLRWAGFRVLDIGGSRTAVIWATRDGPVVRAALRVAGFDGLPVRYFESGAVPDRYKGWPFEENDPELTRDTLDAMEREEASGGEPWVVRDQRMAEIRWYGSWADWKAAALNKLFEEQCAAPGRRPANITAATVRHGESKFWESEGKEEADARATGDTQGSPGAGWTSQGTPGPAGGPGNGGETMMRPADGLEEDPGRVGGYSEARGIRVPRDAGLLEMEVAREGSLPGGEEDRDQEEEEP